MSQRLIVLLYIVLLTGCGVWAGALFLEARAEHRQLRAVQSANEAMLAAAEARFREQERILERLRTDPKFVEKTIRDQLGFGKRTEINFRFETAR